MFLFVICFAKGEITASAKVDIDDSVMKDELIELAEEYNPVFEILPKEGKELFKDEEFRLEFLAICNEYNIPPELVISVIKKESSFDPEADNGKCVGLMQINEKWHKDRMDQLGITDLMDPLQNIKVGVDYLAELKENREIKYALMIYNMGFKKAKERLEEKGYSSYANTIVEYAEELSGYVNIERHRSYFMTVPFSFFYFQKKYII